MTVRLVSSSRTIKEHFGALEAFLVFCEEAFEREVTADEVAFITRLMTAGFDHGEDHLLSDADVARLEGILGR